MKQDEAGIINAENIPIMLNNAIRAGKISPDILIHI